MAAAPRGTPAPSINFLVKPEEKRKYDALFDQLKPQGGFLPGEKVTGHFFIFFVNYLNFVTFCFALLLAHSTEGKVFNFFFSPVILFWKNFTFYVVADTA